MKNQNFHLSKAILTIFLLLFVSFKSNGQLQTTHYEVSCTGTGQDFGRSIVNRIDSGYAIAGYSYQSPACIGSYEWMFLKLKSNGFIECARLLGLGQDDKSYSLIQTNNDTGYTMAGYTTNPTAPYYRKATIMKLNKNCNLLLSRCAFDSLNSTYYQIAKDPSNTAALTGYIESHITVGYKRNKILVSQYTPAGVLNWSARYGAGGLSKEEAYSICFQPAGGFHGVAARTNFYSGSSSVYDIMLMKLTYGGAEVWSKVYRFSLPSGAAYPNTEPRKIISMPDGGFVVVGFTNVNGSTQRDIFVMRVNAVGGIMWSRTYGATGLIEDGESIVLDGNNLVITGTIRAASPIGPPNAFMMRISTAGGSAQWTRIWDNSNPTDAGFDIINSITGTTSPGYAVTGHTTRGAQSNNAFLWRTNSSGRIPGTTCNDSIRMPARTNLHKLDSFPVNRSQVIDITRATTQVTPPTQSTQLCLGTSAAPTEDNSLKVPKDINDINDIKEYSLNQNSPNPFNPTTSINYQLPAAGFASIKVFDISGRLISTLVNEFKPLGSHTVTFDGSNLSSGVYYYKIEAEGFTDIKKMILIK